jgi:hypothetical protein
MCTQFAELGVWRGGGCVYARGVLNVLGQRGRRVHAFDAFRSLPGYKASSGYLASSMTAVANMFHRVTAFPGVGDISRSPGPSEPTAADLQLQGAGATSSVWPVEGGGVVHGVELHAGLFNESLPRFRQVRHARIG